MAKVDTVGMNTITIPLTIPGAESGRITLLNTFSGLAPKSWAASIKLFGTTVQENIYNGMWNYGAALSLIMLLLIGIMGLFTNDENSAQNESGGVI